MDGDGRQTSRTTTELGARQDTLASLQRSFDRNALREFDWKVLFQISPADSSTLIDSPAASRLGTNRGLLHSEELGMLEKFRPYAI